MYNLTYCASAGRSIIKDNFFLSSVDVPKHSLESSARTIKRKDSNNSISSVKEPDIPEPKNDVYTTLPKDKVLYDYNDHDHEFFILHMFH